MYISESCFTGVYSLFYLGSSIRWLGLQHTRPSCLAGVLEKTSLYISDSSSRPVSLCLYLHRNIIDGIPTIQTTSSSWTCGFDPELTSPPPPFSFRYNCCFRLGLIAIWTDLRLERIPYLRTYIRVLLPVLDHILKPIARPHNTHIVEQVFSMVLSG